MSTTTVTNALHTVAARAQEYTPAPVRKAAADGARAFRSKPWTTSALVLALVSLAFNIIASWTTWTTFSDGTGISGTITLTEVRTCSDIRAGNTDPYAPNDSCTIFALLKDAPSALGWLYSAGAASLSFIIFALIFNVIATWLTYLRRISSLHTLPAFAARAENIMVTVALQGATTFCLMIAFAVWSSAISSHTSDLGTLASLYMAQDNFPVNGGAPGPVYGTPSFSFVGGFAVTIIAFILSPASAVILYLKRDEAAIPEAEPAPPGVGGAHGGDPAATAVQDAYPSGALPPAMIAGGHHDEGMADIRI